jgi:hypothetical protein
MTDIRSKLFVKTSASNKEMSDLGVHTEWPAFLSALKTVDLPSKTWVYGVTNESTAYLERMNLFNMQHKNLIGEIKNTSPILRVSHQPNLFAGLNIMGLNFLMSNALKALDAVPIFVSIDYDEAGDQRFRAPMLPSAQGQNLIYLRGAVPRSRRRAIACSIEKPRIEV